MGRGSVVMAIGKVYMLVTPVVVSDIQPTRGQTPEHNRHPAATRVDVFVIMFSLLDGVNLSC